MPAVTRRDFISASAAGAVLLAAGARAMADNPNPPKRRERPDHAHHHHDETHDPRPTCVTTAPNETVITCDDQGKVYRWKLNNNGVPVLMDTLSTHGHDKAACVAGSDNGRVIVGNYDATVDIIDLIHPANSKSGDHKTPGNKPEVWAVAITATGSKAVSATNVGEIRSWNVTTGESTVIVNPDGEPVAALAFVDDKRFLSGHSDGGIALWNLAPDGTAAQSPLNFPDVNASAINSICVFRVNGAVRALTGSFDGEVRLWDLGDLTSDPPLPTVIVRHKDFVWRVAASPGGTRFASAGEDGKVHVFLIDGSEVAGSPFSVPGGSMGVAFVSETRVFYTVGQVAAPQVEVRTVP